MLEYMFVVMVLFVEFFVFFLGKYMVFVVVVNMVNLEVFFLDGIFVFFKKWVEFGVVEDLSRC